MKFIFSRAVGFVEPYQCPFGNFGRDDFDVTDVGFLTCNGIKGLIEKLRKLLS